MEAIAALEGARVGYMLTGSLASSVQGEPRATHDIDLVIDVDARAVDALAHALGAPRFYFDDVAARSALAERGLFNLLDASTGDKIEFWALTVEPFDESRFSRRVPVTVFGATVFVSPPEDTILQKLKWSVTSGRSDRHFDDAVGVYELQVGVLDEDYLDAWAATLGVQRELAVVRERSSS